MAVASRLQPSRVELFRVLSEPGRLQTLALCATEEFAVGELAQVLRDSQPQVSRKVGPLRDAGLLESRRDGTRTLVKLSAGLERDPVISEAITEGRRLCLEDGSLARVPGVIAAREATGLEHFDDSALERPAAIPASPEHLAHLAALSPLLPGHALAVDVGTGDGLALDLLAPLYERVIAVDRSQAQLARVAQRVAARGFHHVSLHAGSYDDTALLQRVDSAGGADLVFAGRTLHHASRPAQAVASFARLLRRGGFLIVLDYLPHEHDTLRAEAGDAWLGFAVEDMQGFFTAAGLVARADVPIPPAFRPAGHDEAIAWHAWVAQRPITTTPVAVSTRS